MVTLPEQFRIDFQPEAAREAVVRLGSARFTVLTNRLIRLEHDPSGSFEDRPSQTFWYRDQPVPSFAVRESEGVLEIETDCLRLRYDGVGDRGFTPETLAIDVKSTGTVWHPGDADDQNLRGTTRTLDAVNGYTPLSKGLVSRAGWAVFDDSLSLVFNRDCWLTPRAAPETDWYFFGYGRDYKACLQDYCRVSGRAPMIPRWMLGNWWSRYWAYTQHELMQLIHDFQAHEIPLSVCIVDMDWHVTQTGNTSTGWTGYTWNRELFPDPQGMVAFLHDNGLRTALNLHPAEGIHPHEDSYPEMARRLGIDPASGQPVEFDITDPEFVRAYFEVLHYPYEAMGVDFWWMDWQQGLDCQIPGLDPLWLINHLHFYDRGRDGTRRPFIFSRWGDKGHQRYPIGFSGDSYATWDSLRFQPYMTASASNIAYGWWSHDIGGHTSGDSSGELFARWVQFGVFSPILRIHTTKGYFFDRRPWAFDDEVGHVLRDALRLRHALIPYLYTMAARAHEESLPLMLPMYYAYPETDAAYACPQQYLFGTELIAAPFVEPADADTRLSRQVVWLPEGDWYHFFTGEHFDGDRWHAIYGTLRDMPLFAKAGAIIPMGKTVGWGGIDNPTDLHIHLFAGADNTFTLYEDDGETGGYLSGHACRTQLALRWRGDRLTFTMDAPTGDLNLIPAERSMVLSIHGVKGTGSVVVTFDDAPLPVISAYDPDTETLQLEGIRLASASTLQVAIQSDDSTLIARRPRRRDTLLRLVGAFRLNIGVRNKIAEEIDAIMADPDAIAPLLLPMTDSQVRALVETLYEAGAYHVHDAHDPDLLVLWNNREDERITYRYDDAYLYFGFVQSAHHEGGVAPRFRAFTPLMRTWSHGMLAEHVHPTLWRLQVDYRNLATSAESRREETP